MNITDADRQRAAEILIDDWREHDAEKVAQGLCDDWKIVVSFAAHRTRAHTEGHTEGYEAAVRDVVAWLREKLIEEYGEKVAEQQEAWWFANAIERGEFKP